MGLKLAIKLCVDKGIKRVTILTDSSAAITIVSESVWNKIEQSDPLQNLIAKDKDLKNTFDMIHSLSRRLKQLCLLKISAHGVISDIYASLNDLADKSAKEHAKSIIRDLLPSSIKNPKYQILSDEFEESSSHDVDSPTPWLSTQTLEPSEEEDLGLPPMDEA